MTDKKKDDAPSSAGKKPAALIDLKATVVETVTVSQPSVETRAAFAQPAAKSTASAPAQASTRPAAPAGTASVPSSSPSPASSPGSAKVAEPATNAAAARAAANPTTTVSARRGGAVSHLVSGVAGGALALLGLSQIGPALNVAWPGSSATDQRLADLEQKLAKATAGDAIASRLAKLEDAAQALASGQVRIATEVKSVEDRVRSAPALPADAAEKLAKLDEQLAQMVAAAGANPQTAGRLPQLAQLTAKLAEVETALGARTAQVKTELSQQMDQRFTRSGEVAETVRTTLNQRAQSLEQSMKIVTDETAALRAGMDAVKLDLDKRFREAAKPADVQTAVASVSSKVAAIEQSMQGVVKSEGERNQTAGNILLALELANLKRALDRGGKYASELTAVKALAGGKLDLAVLESQQNTGFPSLALLGQELAQTAHAMLDAEAEPTNASVADRFLSGVKSIVRVRKVQFAPGDASTEAVIARMETALKEGRIGDVLDESRKLSEKAAAPAVTWLDRIKSRAAVDATLAALDASLKTSLSGGAAPKKVSN